MQVEAIHTHDECVICEMLISSKRQIDRPGTELCDRCAKALSAEFKKRAAVKAQKCNSLLYKKGRILWET